MNAALRVFRCTKGKLGQGLLMSSARKDVLTAHFNVDWAACAFSRRSITGFTIKLGDSLVYWKSKKQSVLSRSLAESEYISLASIIVELTWLIGLIKDLQISLQLPVTIFSDNKTTLQMAANPVYHDRTKHIGIDYHSVREKIQQTLIKTEYLSTQDQPVDIFSKGLTKVQHEYLMSKLGFINLFSDKFDG